MSPLRNERYGDGTRAGSGPTAACRGARGTTLALHAGRLVRCLGSPSLDTSPMMVSPVRLAFATLAAMVAWAAPGLTHGGGGYRGPGDPPPGGSPPPPSAPNPGDTVLPGTPGAPRGPGGGSSGAGPQIPQPRSGGGASSGGMPGGTSGGGPPSLFEDAARGASAWEWWWRMNGEAYLPPLRSRSGLADDLVALDRERAARDVALPVFLEIVRTTKYDEVRSSAMIAAAKLGSLSKTRSELREGIEPHLADARQECSEVSAVALGLLGDRGAIDVLRETMLGDAAALRERGLAVGAVPERTRAFAAYGLGLLGERASHVERSLIVTTLVQWVDAQAARAAQAELSAACLVALSLLPLPMDARRAVHGDWPSERPTRVDSLDAQILWLVHRLGDRSLPFQARAQAPTAIARLAASTPERHWLRSLAIRECAARLADEADEPLEIQVGCVLALGMLGDAGLDADAQTARTALQRAIVRRRDPSLAALALISLGRASARPGPGPEPWKALFDERGPRRVLADVVGDGKSADRSAAAIGLAVLERGAAERGGPADPRSLEILRKALADSRAPERISAVAVALGIARDRGAADALRAELSRCSDPVAKGFLALSLGMIGDASSVPALEELLRRSRFQWAIVGPLSRALAMLDPAKAEEHLLKLLEEAASGSSKSVVALGLANAGGERSIPPLLAEIGRESLPQTVRSMMVAVLGRVSDPRERPWVSSVSWSANWFGAVPTLVSPMSGDGLLDLL